MPALLVAGAGAPEPAGQRTACTAQRGRAVGAEAEREREPLPALAVERQAAGLDHVAVPGRRVVPVHAVVVAQVGPAVAGAEEAARPAAKALRGEQSARGLRVPCHEAAAAGCTGVVIALVREARIVQDVDVELALGERLEAHADHDGVARRVGRVGLDDPVEPVAIGVDLSVAQRLRVEQAHALIGGVLLALAEALAVRDDQLEVAHRRGAQVGVVDLRHPAVVERVPDLARRRVRGPEAVLVGLGPDRLVTRTPRGGGGERRRGKEEQQQGKGDQCQRRAGHARRDTRVESPLHRPMPRERPVACAQWTS